MLRAEFPTDIPVTLGACVPPIKQQVAAAGMTLNNHEMWERRHTAWNLLRIGGFLTEAEIQRIGHRLVRGISQDAHFDTLIHTAKTSLGQDIPQELRIEVEPTEPIAPDATEGKPATAGELDRYIDVDPHP